MEINVHRMWLERHAPIFVERFGNNLGKEELKERIFEYLDTCNSFFLGAILNQGKTSFETLVEDFIEEIKTYD